MQVMHVIDPAPFGGAESVVKALSVGRRSLGATVVAALVNQANHDFVTALKDAGVTVEPIVTPKRSYGRQVSRLTESIRDQRVDCVHTHVYHADVIGYFAARRTGRPVVATYHGGVGGGLKNRLYEWTDRRLLGRFDAVICVSAFSRQRLLDAGIAASRLHTIPNGALPVPALERVEARAMLGLPADVPVIGWLGRMSAEKGPDLLLQALEQITHPRALAVMIGDGPERAAVATRVASSALQGRVRLVPSRPDAARLLKAFDILAISSRTEGHPMVLLEAVQAGVAIVGFAVGGLPEYLDAGTGWLVRPEDSPAFGRALDEALSDSHQRDARAQAAQGRVAERLSLSRWIEAVERVYGRVHTSGEGESV